MIFTPWHDVRRDKELSGHDPRNRALISIVVLDRFGEYFLRAASGLTRRSRVGDLVTFLLDLFTKGVDLIRISLERFGNRIFLCNRWKARFQSLQ